jgi:hypothetical protein
MSGNNSKVENCRFCSCYARLVRFILAWRALLVRSQVLSQSKLEGSLSQETHFLTLNVRLASLKARLASTPETTSILWFCPKFSWNNHLQFHILTRYTYNNVIKTNWIEISGSNPSQTKFHPKILCDMQRFNLTCKTLKEEDSPQKPPLTSIIYPWFPNSNPTPLEVNWELKFECKQD